MLDHAKAVVDSIKPLVDISYIRCTLLYVSFILKIDLFACIWVAWPMHALISKDPVSLNRGSFHAYLEKTLYSVKEMLHTWKSHWYVICVTCYLHKWLKHDINVSYLSWFAEMVIMVIPTSYLWLFLSTFPTLLFQRQDPDDLKKYDLRHPPNQEAGSSPSKHPANLQTLKTSAGSSLPKHSANLQTPRTSTSSSSLKHAANLQTPRTPADSSSLKHPAILQTSRTPEDSSSLKHLAKLQTSRTPANSSSLSKYVQKQKIQNCVE